MECGKVLRLQARHCLNLQYFLFHFVRDHSFQLGSYKTETNSLQENRTREIAYFFSVLLKATYFGIQRTLELAVWEPFISGSWRIAARITSLQYFLLGALTRKKIPLLTVLPGSSIKIIRDLRKPHAAFVCLHAFVIAAFQLFNICHRVKSCMNFEVGGFQNRGVCPQAFPPSLLPSPLLLFFALALFLAGNACYEG